MPVNTIIIPFRQSAYVPLCLTSLEVCGDIDQHNIILAQHGGTLYDFNRDDLRMSHWYVCDQDAFHFAKLVNGAVRRARTEWVTIIQPKILVPHDFIARLECVEAEPDCRRAYFPVRYLDSAATQSVESRFNSFYERIIPEKTQWRRGGETHKRTLIGSDCFAIRSSLYLELGGYDERFHSRTPAGIDFGRRWLKAFGPAVCVDCDMFHRWCRLGSFDEGSATDIHEGRLLAEKERQGFPPPSITREWGVFEHNEA